MQYVPSSIKDDTRRMYFLQLVNINATKNTIGITYIRDSIEKSMMKEPLNSYATVKMSNTHILKQTVLKTIS